MVGILIPKGKIVRKINENHKQERVDQAKAVETKKNIPKSQNKSGLYNFSRPYMWK